MLLGHPAVQAAPPSPIFRDPTFEELAGATVTTVSRREERAFAAPAATTVLTGEAVARAGAASLPEALRAVPGLNVAQITPDAWAVGARGFQWQYANKLLVMVDGRSIYSTTLGGVPWEDNPVFLPDLDRVEVVRGPGAAYWGANAVNGVIDIVSRSALSTVGSLSFFRQGSGGELVAGARQGWQLGPRAAVRIYAQHQEGGDGIVPAGTPAGNGYRTNFGGLRFDWAQGEADEFTFQAGGHERRSGYDRTLPALANPPTYAIRSTQPVVGRGYHLSARWRHGLADGAEWVVSGYVDHAVRDRPQFLEEGDTRAVDAVFNGAAGPRGRISAGVGYRENSNKLAARLYSFSPARTKPELFNAFVNGEAPLGSEQLKLSAGARVEHHRSTGWNLQPSLRLAWQPAENVVWWTSAGQAVRTPTVSENTSALDGQVLPAGFLDPVLPTVVEVAGNPNLRAERMTALEGGVRWAPRSSWLVDLSAFAYDYRNYVLVTNDGLQVRSAPAARVLVERFQNGLVGEAYGGELAVTWAPRPGWRLAASSSLVQIQLHTRLPDPLGYEQDEGTTPHFTTTFSSDWQIGAGWDFHLAARQVGAVPYYGIPAYVAVDARLAWRLNHAVEFSLVGRNLLDAWHPEYDSAFNRQLSEMGRTVALMVQWTP